MLEDLRLKIEESLAPLLENIASELVELRLRRQMKTLVVDIIVDHPQGGITVEQCSHINKEISRRIEENQWIEGEYVVEVSSPGLDRPLKTSKDFLRVQGRQVRCHLSEPVKERIEYLGIVENVSEDYVVLRLKTRTIEIPLSYIQKSVQVVI